ncbi:MAG: sugar phosphate isomerase/epimerase [Bacteroidales bacterium]|nr:sugar phosphate isomerase/epimerase [Bacteroidales bacterium]
MKKLYLILAVAAVSLLAVACKKDKPNDNLGLQLYSIRAECSKDITAAIQGTADAGYKIVEAASYNQQEGTFYGMAPKAFADLCASKGINFLSSHTNGPDPNVTPMEECLAWWKKTIADHKAGGCKFIVQPSMSRTAYESLEGILKYCELFNQVGAMCKQQGILFGYHNHNREFETMFDVNGTQTRLYDVMLANCKPENVFFEIDLFWIYRGGGDPIEYFKANPGRFLLWHVKDDLEVGASGKIDFPEIYKHASLAGMQYQIIEQEAFGEGIPPFESIKQSCDYVKTLRPE